MGRIIDKTALKQIRISREAVVFVPKPSYLFHLTVFETTVIVPAIFDFFQAGSAQEINITSSLHHQVAEGLERVPPSGECLIKAQEHVFKLMQTDTYSRHWDSWTRTVLFAADLALPNLQFVRTVHFDFKRPSSSPDSSPSTFIFVDRLVFSDHINPDKRFIKTLKTDL